MGATVATFEVTGPSAAALQAAAEPIARRFFGENLDPNHRLQYEFSEAEPMTVAMDGYIAQWRATVTVTIIYSGPLAALGWVSR